MREMGKYYKLMVLHWAKWCLSPESHSHGIYFRGCDFKMKIFWHWYWWWLLVVSFNIWKKWWKKFNDYRVVYYRQLYFIISHELVRWIDVCWNFILNLAQNYKKFNYKSNWNFRAYLEMEIFICVIYCWRAYEILAQTSMVYVVINQKLNLAVYSLKFVGKLPFKIQVLKLNIRWRIFILESWWWWCWWSVLASIWIAHFIDNFFVMKLWMLLLDSMDGTFQINHPLHQRKNFAKCLHWIRWQIKKLFALLFWLGKQAI